MKAPSRRVKDPEGVRTRLLQAAVAMANRGDFTVEAVARAAGVTKGALFHHYATKDALVNGVVDRVLKSFEAAIAEHLAGQPASTTAPFTRAYVAAALSTEIELLLEWRGLLRLMVSLPDVSKRWANWLDGKLQSLDPIESHSHCWLARCAADGAWLHLTISSGDFDTRRLHDVLNSLIDRASIDDATPLGFE